MTIHNVLNSLQDGFTMTKAQQFLILKLNSNVFNTAIVYSLPIPITNTSVLT